MATDERAAAPRQPEPRPPPSAPQLLLFVAGREPNSRLALRNLEAALAGVDREAFSLQVVDVFEAYQTALEYGAFVTPQLLLRRGSWETRILGNLRERRVVEEALEEALHG